MNIDTTSTIKTMAKRDRSPTADPSCSASSKRANIPFRWTTSYKNRALLVRVKNQAKVVHRRKKGTYGEAFDDCELPTAAAFFTCDMTENDETIHRTEYSFQGKFDNPVWTKAHLKTVVEKNLGIKCEPSGAWDELEHHLEACNYKNEGDSWCPQNPDAEKGGMLEGRLLLLWSEMDKALISNMASGATKKYVHHLVSYVEDVIGLGIGSVQHTAPFPTDDTNGHIQYTSVHDTLFWESSYEALSSSQSPSSSYCESSHHYVPCEPERCKIVPDYVVYLPDHPGQFLLNFECKKAKDNWNSAIVQCTRQMLTQMHFQSNAFGFVISPLKWSLILLQKIDDNGPCIRYGRYEEGIVKPSADNPYMSEFNVQGMISLNNWVYRLMLWGAGQKIP